MGRFYPGQSFFFRLLIFFFFFCNYLWYSVPRVSRILFLALLVLTTYFSLPTPAPSPVSLYFFFFSRSFCFIWFFIIPQNHRNVDCLAVDSTMQPSFLLLLSIAPEYNVEEEIERENFHVPVSTHRFCSFSSFLYGLSVRERLQWAQHAIPAPRLP